jgi:hypothetical protein
VTRKIWKVYKFASIGGNVSCEASLFEGKKVIEQKEVDAHCLACAKTEVMAETGIPADIRGWHMQGMCGSFLYSMRLAIDEGRNEGADLQ